MNLYYCTYCRNISEKPFDVCPACGIDVNKIEFQKILVEQNAKIIRQNRIIIQLLKKR